MTTRIPTSIISPSILDHGKLLLTSGIQSWLDTGVEPWSDLPNPDCLSLDWRRHYLSVIVSSHISGNAGDTSEEDHLLNIEAFANPGRGHRVFTVWRRNHTSTIYAITSDFAGPDAYLTIMFSSEY